MRQRRRGLSDRDGDRMSCGCNQILEAATAKTSCECPAAGFCQRHKCQKNAHFHSLCQNRPDYFDLWENGRGPCMGVAAPDGRRVGLGDVVEWTIKTATFGLITPTRNCACNARKQWLNRLVVWGWWR